MMVSSCRGYPFKTRGILLQSQAWLLSKIRVLHDDEKGKKGSNESRDNGTTSSPAQQEHKEEHNSERYILGSKQNKGRGEDTRPHYKPEPEVVEINTIEPPTNCCMSGCPNCVWVEYAENLTKLYSQPELSRDKVKKELDQIQDQNIKAFIMMELRTRGLL